MAGIFQNQPVIKTQTNYHLIYHNERTAEPDRKKKISGIGRNSTQRMTKKYIWSMSPNQPAIKNQTNN